jgi:hypothetical protein
MVVSEIVGAMALRVSASPAEKQIAATNYVNHCHVPCRPAGGVRILERNPDCPDHCGLPIGGGRWTCAQEYAQQENTMYQIATIYPVYGPRDEICGSSRDVSRNVYQTAALPKKLADKWNSETHGEEWSFLIDAATQKEIPQAISINHAIEVAAAAADNDIPF